MNCRSPRRASESGIADVLAILLVVVLATLAIVALVDATQTNSPKPPVSQPSAAPIAVATVARRVRPAVVGIDATLERGGRSAGSGMVLTSSGQVLTNNHVIANATSITVRTYDGRTFPATVVGYDIVDDVALLQVNGASALSTIDIGHSASVVVGQLVVVLDGDRGIKSSVRALARDVTAGDERDPDGLEIQRGVMELAASLQPVDAGGPVADGRGNIIAIRTAASDGRRFREETADVSFAIPIDRAYAIAGQINAGQNTATVHVGPRAVLGAHVQALPSGGGVVVVDVQRDGPAGGAGIGVNDVIAAVDDVSVASAPDLESVLNRHEPGDDVRVGWFDGRHVFHTATVRLTKGAPA
jgi:S1-C subfamily serine protease